MSERFDCRHFYALQFLGRLIEKKRAGQRWTLVVNNGLFGWWLEVIVHNADQIH